MSDWHPDIPEEYRNQIVTGDARELAKRIPDESVDLIFTDPVYDRIDDYRWLAETAARVLVSGGSVLAFCDNRRTLICGAAMMDYELMAGPVLEHYLVGPIGRLFSHSVQCNVMPCLWLSVGTPKSKWQSIQHVDYLSSNRGHKWGKNEQRIMYRMGKFSDRESIVYDPFTGGGTVPAVCKMLGRNYIASEIDPDTAQLARERVQRTQPPLVGLNEAMQQAALFDSETPP